ncbi:MAG TPA: FAD-dependent oxidoreductase, partial [Longimicrobiales bacterium]|nr:FAD-dependent oxidoreductase [Longimicrobiales bacterium]
VGGEERVVGARVRDALTGSERDVRARVVVNATGPWAERLLEASGLRSEKHVLPSQGIHLLFRAVRLPLASATHIKAPSGREGLAMRRGPYVYVGTSDVRYDGPLESPVADGAAIEDVLRMSVGCFPGLELTADDIVGTWAGVRPLVAEPGKSPRDTPRKDVIWRTRPGILTIAGGKLTTYRRMGQRILDRVAEELGRALPGEERSAEVPLPGAPSDGRDIEAWRAGLLEDLRARGVAAAAAERIAWLYGAEAHALLRYIEEDGGWGEPLGAATPALRGEVRLAVEQGMGLTLEDVLDRRMALLLFSEDQGRQAAPEAAAILARLLGWSDETRAAQHAAYAAIAARHGPHGGAAASPPG